MLVAVIFGEPRFGEGCDTPHYKYGCEVGTHPSIPGGTTKSLPTKSLPGAKSLQWASTSEAKKKEPKVPIDPKTVPTRAQKGKVDPPAPVTVKQIRDDYANAFSKFIALTSATLKGHKATATSGLVTLDEEQTERTERLMYITPSYYPIVITGQCTRVVLEERILKMAKSVTRSKASGDA
ncbi:hypothetical protein EVAR_55409_1 [Eumeta japonica]|uniref:Uncharacterized protein n=1 Tax=Eumeta variegata TaxID=151549 RepID=A0A4C1YSC9_EUMVA|nr:hypothetical protein EVAR_55409_1 [Eumeta japonica]